MKPSGLAHRKSGMRRNPQTLIFDLDGTITNSKPGIVACLRKVIGARRLEYSGPLDRFVGPPAEEWTLHLLPQGSAEDRAALAREYGDCFYRHGWKNSSVFEGVRDMLALLRQQGFPLFICTSMQQHIAARVMDLFDLTDSFTAIYGDKAEYANHGKVELLGRLLREKSVREESAWMIGDRIYDVQAAHSNRIRCIAAGWGYGSPEEFQLADAFARTPADVSLLVTPPKLDG